MRAARILLVVARHESQRETSANAKDARSRTLRIDLSIFPGGGGGNSNREDQSPGRSTVSMCGVLPGAR